MKRGRGKGDCSERRIREEEGDGYQKNVPGFCGWVIGLWGWVKEIEWQEGLGKEEGMPGKKEGKKAMFTLSPFPSFPVYFALLFLLPFFSLPNFLPSSPSALPISLLTYLLPFLRGNTSLPGCIEELRGS